MRKKGKLTGETIGQNYALEYGVNTIEIHADVMNDQHVVLLVDDLIATGDTAIAAVGLLRCTGALVKDAAFVIDLHAIGGAAKLEVEEGVAVSTLMTLDEH